MQGLPPRRWNPGFIAMRWRHIFWLLPLAGMLAGLGFQLWKYYKPTVTAEVQVNSTGFPSTRTLMDDTAEMLQSDEVLSRTVDSLNLAGRWGLDPGACVSKLRKKIRSEPIPGSSLLKVRISGSSRAESIELWKALTRHSLESFDEIQSAAIEAKLAPMKASLDTLKRDLDEKRERLSAALDTDDLRAPGSPAAAETARLKADVEAARRTMEKARLDITGSEIKWRLSDKPAPIYMHPAFSPPLIHRDTLLRLSHSTGMGIGVGIILSVLLAYLLELVFPRKHPDRLPGI